MLCLVSETMAKKSVACVQLLQLKDCFPWQFFSWNHMKIHKMMNPMHHWCYGMSQSPNYYNYNSKTVHQLVCDLDKKKFRETADNIWQLLWWTSSSIRWIVCVHSGTENLKKSRPKNSWNQINQFHEEFFWPNSIFGDFKNGQKSIFELGKSLKLPKMQFHQW